MFNDEDDDWVMGGSSFQESYQCLPASDLPLASLRRSVEYGGKVVLPASALENISRLNVSYPLMFELANEENGRATHCGVLEFSAPEGTIYLPLWVMKTIGLRPNDILNVSNVTLALGTFARLQPQSPDFLDITDPRAVLEHSLRTFSSLTRSDMIQILYNDKLYELEVLEVSPGSSRHAVSIVETDLQVDFASPVGYVEPAYVKPAEKSIAGSLGAAVSTPAASTPLASGSFKPFSGFGKRLNSDVGVKTSEASQAKAPTALKLPPGMLFFGAPAKAAGSPGSTAPQQQPPGAAPFSGQPNKLR